MKKLAGWFVRHPFYLSEVPKERTDLLNHAEIECDFEIHDLYQTEAEAVRRLREYLTEQREQALKDLQVISLPGITWKCSKAQLEQWQKEDTLRLNIADAGLALFPEMQ
jgi:hypothetical protein